MRDTTALDRQTKVHLYNINMDPLLNGRVVHILQQGYTLIGKRTPKDRVIQMIGPG